MRRDVLGIAGARWGAESGCTFLVGPDTERRDQAVVKAVRCLGNFPDGHHDDGGCDEGPSYWGRAGASLFDCLDLLQRASGGTLDGFRLPLVREIGLYICRAHIDRDWYTNFADAPARVQVNGDLVYRYRKRVGSEMMIEHGAIAAFSRDTAGRGGPGPQQSRHWSDVLNAIRPGSRPPRFAMGQFRSQPPAIVFP